MASNRQTRSGIDTGIPELKRHSSKKHSASVPIARANLNTLPLATPEHSSQVKDSGKNFRVDEFDLACDVYNENKETITLKMEETMMR
jgi:hypothetical protein